MKKFALLTSFCLLALPTFGSSPAYVKAGAGICTGTLSGNATGSVCSVSTTSMQFTFTPGAINNGVLFHVGCAATSGTVTAVSLTGSGWTTTQQGSIIGNTTAGFVAAFRAYAPNTSATTFTVSWTTSASNCGAFLNDMIEEWSNVNQTNFVDATGSGGACAGGGASGCTGCSVTPVAADDGIMSFCQDSVTDCGGGTGGVCTGSVFSKGADDGSGEWSEHRVLTGNAGVSQSVTFVPASGAANQFVFAIKAPTAPTLTTSTIFPLSVHASGRYLIDTKGAPFPILGEAGWEAPHNLNSADQDQYIADRVGRGFTAIMTELVEHKYTTSKPPKDLAGNLPFTNRLDAAAYTGTPNGASSSGGPPYTGAADDYTTIGTQAPDFTTPNNTYFATLDAFITKAGSNGMVVFLTPAYVGFAGGEQGWMREMVANDAVTGAGGLAGKPYADASKSKLWNFGAFVADRYRNYTNIIWVLGGDFGTGSNTFSTAQSNAVKSVLQGMQSIADQKSILWTGHWDSASISTDISADATNGALFAGAMRLNGAYAFQGNGTLVPQARAAYSYSTRVMPSFLMEGPYEDEGPTALNRNANATEPNRRFQWWSWLSTCNGYLWGNGYVWTFDTAAPTWQAKLNSNGAQDLGRLNRFVKSINWQVLVPSGLNGMQTLITAGQSASGTAGADYVAAAADPAGSLIVAYVPPTHAGSITVAMSQLSAPAKARWFDPTNGAYRELGTFTNSGTQAFTPPATNIAGDTDWVLLIGEPIQASQPFRRHRVR
jgi:hypothetical protein